MDPGALKSGQWSGKRGSVALRTALCQPPAWLAYMSLALVKSTTATNSK
jgi:hypothetical protein